MGTIFKERTKVDDARRIFLDAIQPIGDTENVPVEECTGRVLASEIIAQRNVPHYRRAAMDGYAVRSSDTIGASPTNPVMLHVEDEITEGVGVRVHTGSTVPDEADAVIMIEDTSFIGDMLEVRAQLHPNKHVGCVGEDIREGERVLSEGHLLRPCDAAVIASLGIRSITVYRRPLVIVIPTGEELVPRTDAGIPPAGMVLETNSLMVGLYVEKWGADARYCDIVVDKPELIREAIQSNLDADMIVICGGTSVGQRDHVPAVVDSLGKILVHGVGLSPGKPTALGIIGKVPVLCLPGYPVAGLVGLFAFGRAALRKVGNIPELPDPVFRLPLSSKITSKIGYVTYARVIIDNDVVRPLMTSGSGVLSSVAKSDGFVIVPGNVEGYSEGQDVDFVLIE